MNYSNLYPTRKAILIGSPGGKETKFLPGVEWDLQNVSKYLQSEKGGVWYESEIETLYNPSFLQVNNIIKKSIADYVVVYFSGHGYTDSANNERMICLKDLNISDKYLLNQSSRQLILIDACRNYSGPGISGIPDFEAEWSYFEGSPVRGLFDRYIMNSPAGKFIVHGTQRGYSSYDSSTGGMFTNALLNIGTRIKAENNYTQAAINRVLEYIPQALQMQNNFQIPSITFRTGNLTIPFAIGVPKSNPQKSNMPIVQQPLSTVNKNPVNAGKVLFISALILFGIAGLGD